MSKKLDDIHKIVTGNGTPENGMVVKLDRVRMVVKVILWASGILGSSTLAGALWFIWKTIQHVGVVQ